MRLPIQTFWLFNRNVSRLLAEKDLRSLTVAASAQSAEGATATREQLLEEFGNPFKSLDEEGKFPNAEPDRQGIELLRRMSNQQRRK